LLRDGFQFHRRRSQLDRYRHRSALVDAVGGPRTWRRALRL